MSKVYKWKYEDTGHPKPECYDCGAPYGSFPDMVLENELWEKINPGIYKGSGLLCPTCISIRLGVLGVEAVHIKIYGGGERIYDRA